MKTLVASIVGIFAVGLALGSFVSGSSTGSDIENAELEAALATAPLVDCGDNREALLEPVEHDGKTSFKVRCVPIEGAERPAVANHSEASIVTRAPAAVVTRTPAPQHVEAEPARRQIEAESARADRDVQLEDDVDSDRTWKESAVVIGGAAGTGAGIGALAKGKKGAAVGAAIGAASGAAYELIKRDKNK